MRLPLPKNARLILQARMKGLRPSDMVIVSLVGTVSSTLPLVQADSCVDYDWRWAHGLDVCLYVPNVAEHWAPTLMSIALTRPRHLNIWNPRDEWGAHVYLVPSAEDVVKPVPMWKYELDFLPWLDFQNQDFVAGRSYARRAGGMPYAVDR
jgi:hypothetical protein